MLRHQTSIRSTFLITLVILGICGLSWFSTQTSPARAQAIKGDAAESTPLACPDAKPVVKGAAPSLDFCSPKYGGNVAGPVGSHIVLIGENFPQDPLYWLLTPNNSLPAAQACLASQAKLQDNCSRLQPPRTSRPGAGKALYGWTWNTASFPTTPANYYFIAVFSPQVSPHFVPSSVSFSLLDSQPPCIMAKVDASHQSDCASAQPLTLSAGTTVTLLGSHWELGWRPAVQHTVEQVTVTAGCAPSEQCTPDPLFTTTIDEVTVQGTFTQQVTVPQNATGSYLLTAFSTTDQQIATPDVNANQSINIIFTDSLTFGMDDDSTKLPVQVVKQVIAPTPAHTPSGQSNPTSNASLKQLVAPMLSLILWLAFILAFVGLVIALFSLFAYVKKNREAGTDRSSSADQMRHNAGGQDPFLQESGVSPPPEKQQKVRLPASDSDFSSPKKRSW